VEAHHAAGERNEAESAMSRLLYVASNADKGLATVERARAAGVTASPKDNSPGPQRIYSQVSLDKFGPAAWEPFPAPALVNEYKGRNVILIFYLGRECLHCMNQLKQINAKHQTWSQFDAVVLAVSPNKIEDTNEAAKKAGLNNIHFLADPDGDKARRFSAYDDFEDMELHATILIDRKGRVHWGSIGGEPFTDMDFLEKQLKRMNQ
jgi:peroxiredoxin